MSWLMKLFLFFAYSDELVPTENNGSVEAYLGGGTPPPIPR
jgi:hypothetical protein